MSLFAELKRRNVYRVAVFYLVMAWLVLQVADVIISILVLPDWVGQLVFLLLGVGFPIALVLAWAFELTPEGIRREGSTPDAAPPVKPTSRRLDLLFIGLLVIALGWFAWHHDWRGGDDIPATGAPTIRSLVVLPLENLMNDPEQAYFVAGMHEALITELSKIEALRVISRTSAKAFEDSGLSVPDIAARLGVDAVVEGSVLRAGDTVRITVQLIEAASDRHLWADNFDRPLRDILALYGEVTREIANQVRVSLSAEQESQMAFARRVDPEAYELYLEGRYQCDQWRPTEMQRGMRNLRQALLRAPDDAATQAALALCLQYAAFFGYERPLEVVDEARGLANAGVEGAACLAEAWVAKAGVQYYLDFEVLAAAQSLERALECDPNSVKALMHYSWLLGESGWFEKALPLNEKALELDPLSTLLVNALGQLHYLARDFDRAVEVYGHALELDPADPSMHYYLGRALEQKGVLQQAIAHHEQAVALSDGQPLYQAALAYSLALAGRQDEAERIREEIENSGRASPYDRALVHLGLGEYEEAIEWLKRSFDARDSHFVYIRQDARFDPLRNEPGFQSLIERIDWVGPGSL